MTTWNQLQQQQTLHIDGLAPAVDWQASIASGYACVMQGQAILRAEGEEAATFLHSQLSNDVVHLGSKEVRLAAYCTPKGRMLASFTMWKTAENILMQMSEELLPATQKRLQMYALRAKYKASPATELVSLGLGGAKALQVLATWFDAEQLAALAANSKIDHQQAQLGSLLRLSDSLGNPRYQWVLSEESAITVWPELAANLHPVASSMWELLAIHAGIARIVSATVEKFVPQMINFELVGGVNFKKGCYPGQEIVARSQYLGKLKRRMYLLHSEADNLASGMEVFSSVDPEQACGMLVNVARNPAGGMDCLAELKSALIEGGQLQVEQQNLQLLSLPYAFPTEQ